MFLCSTQSLHFLLCHQHPLVPFRQPVLQTEVWFLVIQWHQFQPDRSQRHCRPATQENKKTYEKRSNESQRKRKHPIVFHCIILESEIAGMAQKKPEISDEDEAKEDKVLSFMRRTFSVHTSGSILGPWLSLQTTAIPDKNKTKQNSHSKGKARLDRQGQVR